MHIWHTVETQRNFMFAPWRYLPSPIDGCQAAAACCAQSGNAMVLEAARKHCENVCKQGRCSVAFVETNLAELHLIGEALEDTCGTKEPQPFAKGAMANAIAQRLYRDATNALPDVDYFWVQSCLGAAAKNMAQGWGLHCDCRARVHKDPLYICYIVHA